MQPVSISILRRGGAKLIRVRDNGKGIAKDELGLALSRHATSKIHTLDDLEAIMSLGFRGEALASISSVSRLTLTSRPAAQEEAWSAYSEGRDMQVKLQPAAHPIGTTVEVLDLFFNTPARRKFLRTEKTEFSHIDELLKRIALSRFDVSINVRHNGKIIRQYRAAKNQLQTEKRIAAVCGNGFVSNMLRIELEHQGLKLHGWITTPDGARQQSDLQYCYVNGRMMRDKLINHAIRQSYEMSLKPDQFAAYVLFIELDPHQVDVNVHPAKHEVRFHQARLVHDFIYQALSDALVQSAVIEQPHVNESAFYHSDTSENRQASQSASEAPLEQTEVSSPVPECVYQAIENTPAYPGRGDYEAKPRERSGSGPSVREARQSDSYQRSDWIESKPAPKPVHSKERHADPAPSKQEVSAYHELLKTPDFEPGAVPKAAVVRSDAEVASPQVTVLAKALTVVDDQFALMSSDSGVALVSLSRAEFYRTKGQLTPSEGALKAQPLLVPLSITLDADLVQLAQDYQQDFAQLGIQLKARNDKALMVMGVPAPLRQQNLQKLVPDLLSYAQTWVRGEQAVTNMMSAMIDWLAVQVTTVKSHYTLSEAIQIIAELEQLGNGQLPLKDTQFVSAVDFSATIAKLTP
ncbi:This protein is involved in the repair of mismatches in DNA. It is required for dam-dependent methyl-directed DNA mismatch repair. May act as a molecular matchmaker [Vibrio sp. B1FLJ16]|uniref:DNA mismatch repair endonuclease MutL n=1 Tax=Vibrio sp. B1FLJ16 TaxID=2751178 RepID=UPI001AF34007|nr:This protein is involved in the repair of mismatches in DNA. It is required for dam-dependent methyl-directed DNA mismatch repair. May act as a molecular matchmaker [Vibrio sp. B1FLJ16]CAE6918691.1 This protein is involved in the repair of mismatches in DNA. It is required for dam-dependent methyl-directed DNA mismatch repair. May act as a molecular matchmaker [Vibrio sp. B1FLJ16]